MFLKRFDGSNCGGYVFWCPGCKQSHVYYTEHPGGGWSFNGDLDRPTFNPSLLNTWEEGPEKTPRRCHLFLRDGQLEYCSDSLHSLAGQTVPLGPEPVEE